MRRVTVSTALMVVLTGTVFTGIGASSTPPSSPSAHKIQEQQLGPLCDPAMSPVAGFSKDGWRLAYVTIKGGKGVVVVDPPSFAGDSGVAGGKPGQSMMRSGPAGALPAAI